MSYRKQRNNPARKKKVFGIRSKYRKPKSGKNGSNAKGLKSEKVRPIKIGPTFRKPTIGEPGSLPKGFLRRQARSQFFLEEDHVDETDIPYNLIGMNINLAKKLAEPIKREFGNGNLSRAELDRIGKIAQKAAYHSIRRYKVTTDNLDENQELIEDYVRYALALGELLGFGKHLPLSKLDLKGITDEQGSIRFLKLLERETEQFGLEAKISEDSFIGQMILRQESLDLPDFEDYNPFNGIYFMTLNLRGRLGAGHITPQAVYKALPPQTQSNFDEPTVSLETAFAAYDVIDDADISTLKKYGSEIGIYLLAKEVKERTGENVSLPGLEALVKTEEQKAELTSGNGKVFGVKRQNASFGVDIDEMETVLAFLKDEYNQDSDRFFERYGAVSGTYTLAHDLATNDIYNKDMGRAESIFSSGSRLSKLIGIVDTRFDDSWEPKQVIVGYTSAEKIVEHLQRRYTQNSELFFKLYGSLAAPIILAKEMRTIRGISLSPEEISGFISDAQLMDNFIGSYHDEEKRFQTDWNVQPTSLSLQTAEEIIDFSRQKYEEDPDVFFSRYGKGNNYLIEDLEEEGISFEPNDLECITGDGNAFAILLGVDDPRFNHWRTDRMYVESITEYAYFKRELKRLAK